MDTKAVSTPEKNAERKIQIRRINEWSGMSILFCCSRQTVIASLAKFFLGMCIALPKISSGTWFTMTESFRGVKTEKTNKEGILNGSTPY
jgi:hypothetical protein